MIERDRELRIFRATCDSPGCQEYEELETEDFYDAIDMLKEKGWRALQRPDNGWDNRCPVCIKKPKKARGLENADI